MSAAIQAGAGQVAQNLRVQRNARKMQRGSISLVERAIGHMIQARELLEQYAPVETLPPTATAELTDPEGALSRLRHALAEAILYSAVSVRLIDGAAVRRLP